jgi:hypothetical protein
MRRDGQPAAPALSTEADDGAAVSPPLERLCAVVDGLLAQAVARHEDALAAPIPADAAQRLSTALAGDAGFDWIAQRFGLLPIDRALLAFALAFDLEPAYGTACAYLHADAAQRRPSFEWMLGLMCPQRADRWAELARLRGGPLLHHRLLDWAEGSRQGSPWTARPVRVDDQVLRLILGDAALDERLAGWCRLTAFVPQADPVPASELSAPLCAAAQMARSVARALRVHLRVASGTPCTSPAADGALAALAAHGRLGMLVLDAERFVQTGVPARAAMAAVARECWFKGALLAVHGLDALAEADRRALLQDLLAALADTPVQAAFVSHCAWPEGLGVPGGLLTLEVDEREGNAATWQDIAGRKGWPMGAEDAAALAARFRFRPAQIAQAIDDAVLHWQSAAAGAEPSREDLPRDELQENQLPREELLRACRGLCGHALERLARRVRPRAGWPDLVVPPELSVQLREIAQRLAMRARVMQDWGLGRRLTQEHGVAALFFGPSGTGKTLAAEVLAAELGMDLFCIDLAGVVSKYIGETEKNLERLFQAAESANAVLFFDEADALFGKRSEVKDAHDRYANLEVAYLLQKMEQFRGLAILATNLRQNLDEAFTRRLAFVVNFPFPQAMQRRALWQTLWPAALPRAQNVDLQAWADGLPLAGGHIRNIVLAAATYAAGDDGPVQSHHLLRATRREFQKMGKTLSDADWQRLGLASAFDAAGSQA